MKREFKVGDVIRIKSCLLKAGNFNGKITSIQEIYNDLLCPYILCGIRGYRFLEEEIELVLGKDIKCRRKK